MLFISHTATSRAIARAVDFPGSVLARGGDRVLRIVFRGWRSDRAQQLLKVGSVGGAARVPAIVIAGSDLGPAGMDLALDIGRGGIVLRIQRVEFLIQPVLGGNPRIDRAADRSNGWGLVRRSLLRNRKTS